MIVRVVSPQLHLETHTACECGVCFQMWTAARVPRARGGSLQCLWRAAADGDVAADSEAAWVPGRREEKAGIQAARQ